AVRPADGADAGLSAADGGCGRAVGSGRGHPVHRAPPVPCGPCSPLPLMSDGNLPRFLHRLRRTLDRKLQHALVESRVDLFRIDGEWQLHRAREPAVAPLRAVAAIFLALELGPLLS